MVPAAALSGDQRKLVGACGLHTGVLLAFNRKTNRECFRLFHPRVCISGGIQPKILRRCLTEDFFDRGLPARFLFAWPPGRQDQWTEATVPEGIHKATLRIFERLFGLQPGESEPGDWQPILVTLAGEAKNEFVAFYNSVAANAMEVSDREEAAWNKISGYGARLALIGHLACSNSDCIAPDTMRSATLLARWFGNEAARIYALLAEPSGAALLRRLAEHITRKGGVTTVRDLATNYRPLKNQSDLAELQLNQLLVARLGEWLPEITSARGGRPSRRFRLFTTPAGCLRLQNPKISSESAGSADADRSAAAQETTTHQAVELVPAGPDASPETNPLDVAYV